MRKQFRSGLHWAISVSVAMSSGVAFDLTSSPALAAPATAAPPVGWPGPQTVTGESALPDAAKPVEAVLVAKPLGDAQDVTLHIVFRDPVTHRPITAYQPTHTKLMHVILVDDSFHDFIHKHVNTIKDGSADLQVRLASTAGYWVYADAAPRGYGRQVLRFHLPPTGPETVKPLENSKLTGAADPYRVTISQAKLPVGKLVPLTMHIEKNGKPAPDLSPWLGAPAHIVLIGTATHDYIHVHPMLAGEAHGDDAPAMGDLQMGGMDMAHDRMMGHGHGGEHGQGMEGMPMAHTAKAGPDLSLSLMLPSRQSYAMWVQFTGSNPSNVYTVPFVLEGE